MKPGHTPVSCWVAAKPAPLFVAAARQVCYPLFVAAARQVAVLGCHAHAHKGKKL